MQIFRAYILAEATRSGISLATPILQTAEFTSANSASPTTILSTNNNQTFGPGVSDTPRDQKIKKSIEK